MARARARGQALEMVMDSAWVKDADRAMGMEMAEALVSVAGRVMAWGQ